MVRREFIRSPPQPSSVHATVVVYGYIIQNSENSRFRRCDFIITRNSIDATWWISAIKNREKSKTVQRFPMSRNSYEFEQTFRNWGQNGPACVALFEQRKSIVIFLSRLDKQINDNQTINCSRIFFSGRLLRLLNYEICLIQIHQFYLYSKSYCFTNNLYYKYVYALRLQRDLRDTIHFQYSRNQ